MTGMVIEYQGKMTVQEAIVTALRLILSSMETGKITDLIVVC